MSYTPIHVHTKFSILDGAIKTEDYVKFAKNNNISKIHISDHGTMAGIVDLYYKAKKEGIGVIPGIELYVAPNSRLEKGSGNEEGIDRGNYHLTAAATSYRGYQNLCKLSSLAYSEGFYRRPRVDKELLEQFNQDIIITSGCLASEINTKLALGRVGEVEELIDWYASVFDGRYFIELQENGLREQHEANVALIEIAQKKGLPLLACCDCHITHTDDCEAHDVMLCVQTGAKLSDSHRFSFDTSQLYLRTPDEMYSAFFDYPEAVDNTNYVASLCEFEFPESSTRFPIYKTNSTPEDHIRRESFNKLENFLDFKELCGDVDREEYYERLRTELSLICDKGFASYFLIVSDILNWCRSNDIPVGPGRGSAGGSLVAFCLGITELDPIEYGLFFERFLNAERLENPDIDSDISDVHRERVIQYIRDTYGSDQVSQICTFGTMKGKMCIRDIGRVLGLTFAETDKLVKLYPAPKHGKEYSLKEALEMESRLKEAFEENENTRKLLRVALKLEGTLRHTSKHAAGIVISPEPLTDMMPTMTVKDELVTQYEYKDLEKLGFIKFDFLGLKTLTLIDLTVKLVEKRHGVKINWSHLGYNDPKTYELCARGDTLGCFQIDTDGLQGVLKQIKPTHLGDISFCLAAYRPGPIESGMLARYIKRKNGDEPVEYPHPKTESILRDTLGVIIYQEQIMQIAVTLAGYTMGQADSLRKATGKKLADKMKAEKDKFVSGCVSTSGMSQQESSDLFEKIEEFAAYGFNKCLGPKTQIRTVEYGNIDIESLYQKYLNDEPISIYSYNPETQQVFIEGDLSVSCNDDVELFEITLSDGTTHICSMDHEFVCTDGVKYPVREILRQNLTILSV